MRRRVAWLIVVLAPLYKIVDFITTLHGLPSGLEDLWRDVCGYVYPISVVDAALLFAVVTAAIYLFWHELSKLWGLDDRRPSMGDSYHNSGNNYGHMGPVNIGRQSFELNQSTKEEILRKIPRHGISRVEIVGSGRAQDVGREVLRFLEKNGYSLPQPTLIGMLVPPPSGPICFDGGTLTIAADV